MNNKLKFIKTAIMKVSRFKPRANRKKFILHFWYSLANKYQEPCLRHKVTDILNKMINYV